MKVLSKEHQGMQNYQYSADSLRIALDFESSSDWMNCFELFSTSISSFILSELNFRQGERSQVANIYPDRTNYYFNIGNKFNQRGINGLFDSANFMNLFKNSESFPPTTADFDLTLDEFRQDLLDLFIDVEWKASDITKIQNVINEVFSNISQQPSENLLTYIESKITELANVRQSPTRGTEENLPIWKVLAAAVLIGFAAWAVYACYYRSRGCTKKQRRTYETVMSIALITYGAC